jgi:hypothetical protein
LPARSAATLKVDVHQVAEVRIDVNRISAAVQATTAAVGTNISVAVAADIAALELDQAALSVHTATGKKDGTRLAPMT